MKTSSKQIFLEHIVRSIPQYVFWKDPQSVYLGCNDNYAKLIGLNSPEEIVGRTDIDIGWLQDGDPPELFRQGDLETMAGRYIVNQEEWLSLPSQKKILVLVNKSPIFDDEGRILGVLGIATDITEKKRTEDELKETKHRLEGMTMVSASIAHELRTPLSTLHMTAQNLSRYFPFLVEGYHLAEKAKILSCPLRPNIFKLLEEIPQLIETETRAAFTFIDMLLMNVNPQIDNQHNIFSIAKCISQVLARYPLKPSQKKIIEWQEEEDFLIKGKEILVIHIFFNLIKNSLYSIAKARKGDIKIWVKAGIPYNKVYFKDTGSGISAEALPRIFDRFFTKTHHGAGIGLTFCKMIMESLNGKIECESVEGEYTQFILHFPKIN